MENETVPPTQSPGSLGEEGGGSPSTFFSKLARIRCSKYGVIAVASLALFTDMMSYGSIIPLLPEVLERVSFPPEKYAVGATTLFAMYALGLIIATLIFGILSDRYNNRKIPMLAGLCGLIVTTMLFSLCRSYTELMIARVCQGISAAATWVIGIAMVADVFPKERLGSVMGFTLSFNTLGFMLGPVVGGYLGAFAGVETPFYLCTGLAGLDLFARLFFETPKPIPSLIEPSNSTKSHSIKESQDIPLRNNLLQLWRHTEIALLSISTILCSSSFATMESLVSEYLQSYFSLSLTAATNAICFITLPCALSSYLIGTLGDRFKRTRVILLGLVTHAIISPLLGLPVELWLFCVLCVLFSVTHSLIFTSTMPELANAISKLGYKENSYAKIYAIFNICYSIGMFIGPLIAGYIMESWGFLWVLSITPLLTLLFLPVYLILTLKIERKHNGLDDAYNQVFQHFWSDLLNIRQPRKLFEVQEPSQSSILTSSNC